MTIVTSTYCYKRPPRKKKAVLLEGHQRRGDAADALFREMVHRATGKQ